MKTKPIQKIGGSRQGTLSTTYEDIRSKVGRANVTKLDDPSKVKASWGFEDAEGRQGFIWCYKHYGALKECNEWSIDGDKNLLFDLFGNKVSFDN